MDAPEQNTGFAPIVREYLQRRSRQTARIVRNFVFGPPPPPPPPPEILTDEGNEAAARAAMSARLRRLDETLARLGGEVTRCPEAALSPAREEEIRAMALEDSLDVRGLWLGDGAMLSRQSSIDRQDGNIVVVAPNARLSRVTLVLRGSGNLIYVGASTRMRNVVLKVIGDDNTIAIGRDVTCESGALLCEREGRTLIVGDDCMLSNGVALRTTDHHAIFDRSSAARLNEPADVLVGPHVWLGNGARINKGARIGRGTVVGQTSIVSGELEPNCIYVGAPARKLRGDVVWSRDESYTGIPQKYR